MWFFGRKKSVPDLEPGYGPPDPEVILIDGTMYEDLINKVLEKAKTRALDLRSGDMFTVTLDESEIPEGAYYGEITFPIMFRAQEYGLLPGASHNWTFSFTKP